MSVLPIPEIEFIQFCEYHIPVWTAAPTTIGLTAAQVLGLKSLTDSSRAAFTAAQNARNASKAATTALRNAVRANRGTAADLIKVIKAFAESTNNPNVYSLAQIPPPASPQPNPLPTKPTDVSVLLNGNGALTITWRSTNSASSRGAFFTLARRLGTDASVPFTGIGGAATTTRGRGEFVDGSVPVGTTTVAYIITPMRGTEVGQASDVVTVQFGVGGGVSVSGATLQMAA